MKSHFAFSIQIRACLSICMGVCEREGGASGSIFNALAAAPGRPENGWLMRTCFARLLLPLRGYGGFIVTLHWVHRLPTAPAPTPLTESLRYRCAGRKWWGGGELACCPSCRIARRYWSHKTHSITAVWLLKIQQKKKQKKKKSSWKLVPECGLAQVFNHWKGHSQKMWVPVASSLKKRKQTKKTT